MSPPSSPTHTSRLPLDIVRLIARAGAGTGADIDERELAKAVSLVCRDLRDVGQDALWWRVVLRQGAGEVDWREDARREQLMGRAKVVRLEGEDGSTEEDIEEAIAAYEAILASSQRVTAVELDDVPAEALPRAIAAISSSPSRTCMSSLFIRGAVLGLDGAVHSSETTLIDFLHSLPALTSLALHLWGFPPASPVVSSPVAILPPFLQGPLITPSPGLSTHRHLSA
ncbi:hypothetical protein JCM10213_003387 [Rhodosporidiobolus nylandii]